MLHNVRFSIRTKITLVISLMITVALAFYVFVATRLFNSDKSAYIFESSLAAVESIETQLLNLIDSTQSTTQTLAASVTSATQKGADTKKIESLMQTILDSDPALVEFQLFEKRGNTYVQIASRLSSQKLTDFNIDPVAFQQFSKQNPPPFKSLNSKRIYAQISPDPEKLPILTLGRLSASRGHAIVARILLDKVAKIFGQNQVYTTYLISKRGNILAASDPKKLSAGNAAIEEKYIQNLFALKESKGVQEYKNNAGEPLLVAYSKLNSLDAIAVAQISKAKAFLVAKELTNRSILFGLFIVGIAIITGILLARTLTRPLRKLFFATQNVAKGDFSTRVMISTRDEIGVLGASFNMMAERIVFLLEQEKEKIALDKELEIAQLVQNSFFPSEQVKLPALNLSAYYTPSARCGGDWWYYFEHGDDVLLLIGDATGHGVPAALITATAASCCTTLEETLRQNKELLNSPARVLGYLNRAVQKAAQGKVLMTFFAATINAKAGRMTYSNAAHNNPIVLKETEGEATRKNLVPLMGGSGTHLGLSLDSVYEDDTVTLSRGDSIVFFTDGLIESMNKAGQEFGKRRFLNAILKGHKGAAEDVKNNIMTDAYEFYEGVPPKDDITLVIAKIG